VGSNLHGYFGDAAITFPVGEVNPEAKRLMEVTEKEIRKTQGRMAIIETSSKPAYEKTRHFHISHGYEVIARIPDFYAPSDDKLILQKRLR
jgi:methionyl aminopeptidase